MKEISKSFDEGRFVVPGFEKKFSDCTWNKHPKFEGVEIKNLLTGKETDGKFSFHLVHVFPNCSIKEHIHETQIETHEVIEGSALCKNDGLEIDYVPGTVSVFPMGVKHEVNAGDEGIYLLAKFFPASC